MKRIILFSISVLIFISCSNNYLHKLFVNNNLEMKRPDEMIVLPASELPFKDFSNIKVVDKDKILPTQMIDLDLDGKIDHFAVLVNFEENEQKALHFVENKEKIKFEQRAHAEISEKRDYTLEDGIYKGGHFESVKSSMTPEGHIDHDDYYKFEGPGWESDLIGYRFYLDWRNSTDIFGKKVSRMVLPKVGQVDAPTYHELNEWGMDVFKVGNSLGVGTFAALVDGKIEKVSKTDSILCTIADDGPIMARVNTKYYGWETGNAKVDLISNISINAGSRLTKQVLETSGDVLLASGLEKHENTSFIKSEIADNKWNYIAVWGNQSLNNDNLGIALFYLKNETTSQLEDDLNYIVSFGTNKVTYYYSANWGGEPNGINSLEDYKKYLNNEVDKLNSEIEIK